MSDHQAGTAARILPLDASMTLAAAGRAGLNLSRIQH